MSESANQEQKERIQTSVSVIEEEKAIEYFDTIKNINTQAFPTEAFVHQEIQEALKERRSVLVMLKDETTGEAVGYALATITNKQQTAHYVANAILPEFQGKKLVIGLSAVVEEELRNKGFLDFTRDTRVSGGYANKVRKFYIKEKRLKHEEKIEKNSVGEYVRFTVDLY